MSIQIPCPNCGKHLKIPDRSLLGRKGKCPKCAHTFVLAEPTVVPPEATGSPAPPPNRTSEDSAPSSSKTETVPSGQIPSEPVASPQGAPPDFNFSVPPELAALDRIATTKGTTERLKERQKQNSRRRNIGLGLTGLALAVIAGMVFIVPRFTSKTSSELPNQASSDAASQEHDAVSEAGSNEGPAHSSPTHGKPIELQYIPFGSQVVLNLRPAELWKPDSLGEEIRFCAPALAQFIEKTLQDLFQRKPEQVEELMICLIPGMRGTLPDVAAVAHLTEEQKRSQLIEQFGMRDDSYSQPVYISEQRAYMIVDQRTLVVCPKSQAQEMVDAVTQRHPAEAIDPLLPFTDRDRHLTAIFNPQTLTLQETWFPQNVLPLIQNSVDWLGDDVETVAWSIQLSPDEFFSEILLHGKGVTGKKAILKLENELQEKLAGLAEHLLPYFQQMNPQEKGKRMVIGRVPAMMEVFSMATEFHHGPEHVQLVTSLPDVAGPNLVLGAMLSWEESTRTDFTKSRPLPADPKQSKIPEQVADRLQMRIDVDFRRMPLNEAFDFIAGEIKTPIEIDGDALKLGGFTKNIAQTFKMDGAPVKDVVLKIFADSKGIDPKPEKTLVIIVDEARKNLLVTTLAAASASGLKPFELTK
ncbi:hypothetical protein [Schlesneria sp. T3-172]|uniref:hypothetical protein n=1 Tax=Schlesneria sphaerica TaxID=3373610 RepID=UPI0037CB3EC6